MKPLKWPMECGKLTPWQRLLMDAPFVGVRDRMFKDIAAQIGQRTADCSDSWTKFSPLELDVERELSRIAMEELGWPNNHFVPLDPFEIIMWDGSGDLGTAAALDRIESELGLKRRSDEEWQELASRTFGEVVQKIAEDVEALHSTGNSHASPE